MTERGPRGPRHPPPDRRSPPPPRWNWRSRSYTTSRVRRRVLGPQSGGSGPSPVDRNGQRILMPNLLASYSARADTISAHRLRRVILLASQRLHSAASSGTDPGRALSHAGLPRISPVLGRGEVRGSPRTRDARSRDLAEVGSPPDYNGGDHVVRVAPDPDQSRRRGPARSLAVGRRVHRRLRVFLACV